MVMTAYFDESGTHGAELPATIFGGFLAREGLWYVFEECLKELFAKHKISSFHAKDFRQRRGRFGEMSMQEYGEFNSSFLQCIDSCLLRGFVIVLPSRAYNEVYRPRFHKKKQRPDSAYGLCFRAAIKRTIFYMNEECPHDYPFIPVLESGHRNAPDALRIYNELINEAGDQGRECLGALAFEDKKRCLSLAAADSIVYCMYRKVSGASHTEHKNAVPMGPSFPPYYVGTDPRKAQITKIDIDEATLDYISSNLR